MGNKGKNVWSLMKNCISQQIRSNFDGPAKVILLKIIFGRYDIHRKMTSTEMKHFFKLTNCCVLQYFISCQT